MQSPGRSSSRWTNTSWHAREADHQVLRWYEEFEFHRIYHAVNEFAIVDLSALYVDVLKDRLYTFAPNTAARRAAQTVLWKITDALARLVAPILSFLADEVWHYLPAEAKRDASVHTTLFPAPDELAPASQDDAAGGLGTASRDPGNCDAFARGSAQQKSIGKALEAKLNARTSR